MADLYEDVNKFIKKFKVPAEETPTLLTQELMTYRIKFLNEELMEIIEANNLEDLEGVFDGLIDLVYVALGTAIMMGLPFEEGWDRVQKANMKKVRAKNASESKRNSSIDVVKPKDWKPPYLGDLV